MATTPGESGLLVYVPRWVSEGLNEGRWRLNAPFAEPRLSAILFLDLSGFSKAAEALAQHGARGAEELANLLNDCFGMLVSVIQSHGGDVAAFAGDGIIVLWDEPDPVESTARAAQCGLALRVAMDSWARDRGSEIRQRIAIEFGEIHRCQVGGHNSHWHYFVVGDPFQILGAAYRSAKVGEVVLCEHASKIIAAQCVGERVGDLFLLDRLSSAPGPTSHRTADLPHSVVEALVPRVVRDRWSLDKGGKWLAEFRGLSVLQISFRGICLDGEFLSRLQSAVIAVQQVAARFDGTFLSALMDDKGINLTVAFGLPPSAHEDDAPRAVKSALAIRDQMRGANVRLSMGISTARAFCGDYGGRERRVFGVHGQLMIVAARLMDVAEDDIICDEATARAASGQISFEVLPQFHFKGRDEPVPGFRPSLVAPRQQRTVAASVIGRDDERKRLRDRLEQAKHGVGSVLSVRGVAGIGKSLLVADMVVAAEAAGVRVLQGFCQAVDRSTPYFAWRRVVLQALEVGSNASASMVRAVLADHLAQRPLLLSWAPVLEAIVSVGIAETELTRQITGEARATTIEDLVVGLLETAAAQPTMLVFEDLHWCDNASIALISGVARRLPSLLITITERQSVGGEERERVDLPIADEVNLDAMSRESVAELVRQRLRIGDAPETLVDAVFSRSSGNPFYSEELIYALRDLHIVSVDRGVCRFSQDELERSRSAFSTNLENLVVSRIDALPPLEQLLLKTASVIGDNFAIAVFSDAVPEGLDSTQIASGLQRLVDIEFLVHDDDASGRYRFRHVIARDVTYNLLAFAQRRELHGRIAAHLERVHSAALAPHYAQLAEHWRQAEDALRAIGYLELASRDSLHNYANREAIRYIDDALALAHANRVEIDSRRRACWEMYLGDAYYELCDFDASLAHYYRALDLLSYDWPASRKSAAIRLVGGLVRQVLHRLKAPDVSALTDSQRERAQWAGHIYERLSEAYFFRNDTFLLLLNTVEALNLAESCGAVAEMVDGYGALGVGLGMAGMVGGGRYYRQRALDLAQKRGAAPDRARAQLVAAVLGFGLGEWSAVEQYCNASMKLHSSLGDLFHWQQSQTILIMSALLQGQLKRAEPLVEQFMGTVSNNTSPQIHAWALATKTIVDWMRGTHDHATLRALVELADVNQARADRLLCLGVAAEAFMRHGEQVKASEIARQGLAVLADSPTVWGGFSYGATGVAETLLAESEMLVPQRARAASGDAASACRLITRVARKSPVLRPRAGQLRGRMFMLTGHAARARREWRQAARTAESLGMAHEAGLAYLQLGRNGVKGDPETISSLSHAAQIFEKFETNLDLALARLYLDAAESPTFARAEA